ncbi:TIGR02186 family protein [Desulfoscipio sp. XC116]|uniref:TIGR02186 family protein n=1 Tax=Desulfoscipio sp. XC116 TaxID=3144975 RepID=UPI00325AE03A
MKKSLMLLLVFVLVTACANAAWAAPVAVGVAPNKIDVGFNFKGADLSVSGTVPEGSDVYVKVASPFDSVLQLNKKGRVGPFWMNVENVDVTAVPKLYQVFSSAPLGNLPPDLSQQYGLTPGFDPVYQNALVAKHGEEGSARLGQREANVYVDSLVNIYQKSGLYAVKENSAMVNGSRFEVNVQLPPNIPQEDCEVTVYAVNNGVLVDQQSVSLPVGSVGLLSWLNHEAVYDGPNYGFMAVLIALVFGTGIALLFGYLESLITGDKTVGLDAGAGH